MHVCTAVMDIFCMCLYQSWGAIELCVPRLFLVRDIWLNSFKDLYNISFHDILYKYQTNPRGYAYKNFIQEKS